MATSTNACERLAAPGGAAAKMSDGALWALFEQRGRAARRARQLFLTLIPEVAARRLHRRRFSSLEECARLVGGVSPGVVQAVLGLHRRLAPYPEVWDVVARCQVGWSVAARVPVREIARAPKAWARNLRELSKREIEALVKEAGDRRVKAATRAMVGGAHRGVSAGAVVQALLGAAGAQVLGGDGCGGERAGAREGEHVVRLELRLSREERMRLEEVRRERERACGERMSLGEVVMELVRDAWTQGDSARLHRVSDAERARVKAEAEVSAARSAGKEPPPRVRRWVWLRARGRCERPGCRRPGRHVHHLDGREGQAPHDPARLALLCDGCHGLVHTGCIENPGALPGQWKIRDPVAAPVLAERDQAYLRKRGEAGEAGEGPTRSGAG